MQTSVCRTTDLLILSLLASYRNVNVHPSVLCSPTFIASHSLLLPLLLEQKQHSEAVWGQVLLLQVPCPVGRRG